MPTSFDRYFERQMEKPAFAKAYAKARAEIDSVDQFIRALDEARAAAHLSKAEVARRIGTSPVVVRRLLTQTSVNPSFQLVSKLAQAVGLRLVLEQDVRPAPARKAPVRRREARASAAAAR
ncbi:helix-turn-helix domain-containing protein [Stigmatella aurantiaca]|uniref:Transcriptional regulator n=1 Tax=Stigmatella aurantiaca (strain DW4/3-1) TaxID=378806 RepID=Q08PP8_STIAD|nr:helix-turn-helix transcriptional regulator [Stigmatella aurantiaca]ADO76026.1 Transcriptional regulator [Stigmatella aurantiaca DW4/3-1]EAU62454.1 transcriptional regulator, XRE family [Stigmatella aurantiaca DW4/3-1]